MGIIIHKKIIKFFILFFLIFILISTPFLFIKKINNKSIYGHIVTKEIDVFSLESAKIQKILVHDNDFVKKNDLLIQFDTNIIDNKIKQIQACIDCEKTKENLLKFKEEKILEEYLNYKKDKNDLKDINTKLKVLESVQLLHNILLKKIAKLQADLSFYNEKKNNLFIYSPCNGLIQNLNININQNIRCNDKLLTIADSDNIWLEAKIKKSCKYKIGDNFCVFIENLPKSKYQGKIFYLSLDKNSSSKEIDVKLSVNQLKMKPNEITHLLTNGMKAHFKYE